MLDPVTVGMNLLQKKVVIPLLAIGMRARKRTWNDLDVTFMKCISVSGSVSDAQCSLDCFTIIRLINNLLYFIKYLCQIS